MGAQLLGFQLRSLHLFALLVQGVTFSNTFCTPWRSNISQDELLSKVKVPQLVLSSKARPTMGGEWCGLVALPHRTSYQPF